MNNRYTFKAKRKDNGEWVYGNVIINPNSTDKVVIIESGVTSYSSTKEAILEFINDYVEIIPETLCQCTGLQDKDGKDIFENDIVSFMEDGDMSVGIIPLNITGIIQYLEGCYVVSQENTNYKYIDLLSYTINPTFKIINNKFDKEEG